MVRPSGVSSSVSRSVLTIPDGTFFAPRGAGGRQPFEMAGPNLNPPFSFLWREKRKRAVHGPKEKSVFIRAGGKLWLGGSQTRSPCRFASASNSAAAAAVRERVRCGWWLKELGADRDQVLSTTAERQRYLWQSQVSDGLPVDRGTIQQISTSLTSVFFSFGPSTARFLFFFAKKKRKWGVELPSRR